MGQEKRSWRVLFDQLFSVREIHTCMRNNFDQGGRATAASAGIDLCDGVTPLLARVFAF